MKIRKFRLINIFKFFVILFLIFAIVGATVGTILVAEIIKNIPNEDEETMLIKERTIIYDKDGNEVYKIGAATEVLEYDQIPELFIEAQIAIEDSRFFSHNGVDRPRFLKATIDGGASGGASTITMQISKLRYTQKGDQDETTKEKMVRKIQDLYVSTYILEEENTKEEIFAFYANSVNFGTNVIGLHAASWYYFSKTPDQLNLAEVAMIAGMPNNPSADDPLRNGTERAESRRNTVLDLMVRHGYIDEKTAATTKEIPVLSYLNPGSFESFNNQALSDFANAAIAETKELTGLDPYKYPMKIYTTMDKAAQEHVYSVKMDDWWSNDKIKMASATIDNKDGSVIALMSGRDVNGEISFNYATEVSQQIGSTAKPLYDYAPCFEQGKCKSINETIADQKYTYSDGTPIYNWDRKYLGTISLSTALNQSRNIPALKVFQRNDPVQTSSFVQSIGLHPDLSEGVLFESHSIGGYDSESPVSVAGAYSSFARGGTYQNPTTLKKVIVNYRLPDAQTFEPTNRDIKTVMKPETADAINQMLNSNVGGGSFGSKFNSWNTGSMFAYKSGTTNIDGASLANYGYYGGDLPGDYWAAVYSPEYTTTVWVGYDKLSAEHIQNGWYLSDYEGNVRDKIAMEIVTGDFQPKVVNQFPNWGVANKSVIKVEVAEKDKDEDGDGLTTEQETNLGTDPKKSDSDGDGVNDSADKCPIELGNAADGCKSKDSDSDGVLDVTDVCPNTAAGTKVDEKGCPIKTTPPPAQPTPPTPPLTSRLSYIFSRLL